MSALAWLSLPCFSFEVTHALTVQLMAAVTDDLARARVTFDLARAHETVDRCK